MSRTLFWYIFRDLLRVFLMAVACLAGIMAFGGLLKPLTEHGLNAAQAAKVLVYFLPATQTYALPISALFATTMVYGRLSADNELTACRASGISSLSLTMPALVLGLGLAMVSLLCLCFVAPHFMLKAERVVFANIADVVKKRIDRSHQLTLGPYTIFANSAELGVAAGEEGDQVVLLHGVVFLSYDSPEAARRMELPGTYWTADRATAYIRQAGDDVEFRAQLHDGMKIDARVGAEGAAREAVFGPVVVPSPIRERTQFMDIRRLKSLSVAPWQARTVREQLDKLLRRDLEHEYLRRAVRQLKTTGACRFDTEDESYTVQRGEGELRVAADQITIVSRSGTQDVSLVRQSGSSRSVDKAGSLSLQVEAIARVGGQLQDSRMRVALVLKDATLDAGTEHAPHHDVFRGRRFSLPMPQDLAQRQQSGLGQYLQDAQHKVRGSADLRRELQDLWSKIITEIHGRASFAVGCFILVMVGCALGILFRSGDFLTAFAISAVPALFSIALVSTGQHVGEGPNSLHLGIGLIWSGNAAVLALAVVLLWRLQRQ